MMPGGRPADAMLAIQKGPAALERAMQLNPTHAEAMATHGGVQAFMGLYKDGPAGAAKGVDEMNRAIALAPTNRRVRLQRAFSGINLPDALRNRGSEAEDLDFLIALASGTRPGREVALARQRGRHRASGRLGRRRYCRGGYQEAARAGGDELPDVPWKVGRPKGLQLRPTGRLKAAPTTAGRAASRPALRLHGNGQAVVATVSCTKRSLSTAAGGSTNGYPSASPRPRLRLFNKYVIGYQLAISRSNEASIVPAVSGILATAGSSRRRGRIDTPQAAAVSSVSVMCR